VNEGQAAQRTGKEARKQTISTARGEKRGRVVELKGAERGGERHGCEEDRKTRMNAVYIINREGQASTPTEWEWTIQNEDRVVSVQP